MTPTNSQAPVLSGGIAGSSIEFIDAVYFASPKDWSLIDIKSVKSDLRGYKASISQQNPKHHEVFTLKQFMAYIKEKQRSRPYRVQWYRDGQGIKGANGTSYTLTSYDVNCKIISVHHKPIF